MAGLEKLNSIFQKKKSLSFFNSSVTDLESNLDYDDTSLPTDGVPGFMTNFNGPPGAFQFELTPGGTSETMSSLDILHGTVTTSQGKYQPNSSDWYMGAGSFEIFMNQDEPISNFIYTTEDGILQWSQAFLTWSVQSSGQSSGYAGPNGASAPYDAEQLSQPNNLYNISGLFDGFLGFGNLAPPNTNPFNYTTFDELLSGSPQIYIGDNNFNLSVAWQTDSPLGTFYAVDANLNIGNWVDEQIPDDAIFGNRDLTTKFTDSLNFDLKFSGILSSLTDTIFLPYEDTVFEKLYGDDGYLGVPTNSDAEPLSPQSPPAGLSFPIYENAYRGIAFQVLGSINDPHGLSAGVDPLLYYQPLMTQVELARVDNPNFVSDSFEPLTTTGGQQIQRIDMETLLKDGATINNIQVSFTRQGGNFTTTLPSAFQSAKFVNANGKLNQMFQIDYSYQDVVGIPPLIEFHDGPLISLNEEFMDQQIDTWNNAAKDWLADSVVKPAADWYANIMSGDEAIDTTMGFTPAQVAFRQTVRKIGDLFGDDTSPVKNSTQTGENQLLTFANKQGLNPDEVIGEKDLISESIRTHEFWDTNFGKFLQSAAEWLKNAIQFNSPVTINQAALTLLTSSPNELNTANRPNQYNPNAGISFIPMDSPSIYTESPITDSRNRTFIKNMTYADSIYTQVADDLDTNVLADLGHTSGEININGTTRSANEEDLRYEASYFGGTFNNITVAGTPFPSAGFTPDPDDKKARVTYTFKKLVTKYSTDHDGNPEAPEMGVRDFSAFGKIDETGYFARGTKYLDLTRTTQGAGAWDNIRGVTGFMTLGDAWSNLPGKNIQTAKELGNSQLKGHLGADPSKWVLNRPRGSQYGYKEHSEASALTTTPNHIRAWPNLMNMPNISDDIKKQYADGEVFHFGPTEQKLYDATRRHYMDLQDNIPSDPSDTNLKHLAYSNDSQNFYPKLLGGTNGPDNMTVSQIKSGNNIKGIYGKVNQDENAVSKIESTQNGMPFYFKDLRDNSYIILRAYLNGIAETVSPSWNSENYVGRSEAVYVYQNAERELNFTMKLFAGSQAELMSIYAKLDRLTSMCYPEYIDDTNISDVLNDTTTRGPNFTHKFERMKPPYVGLRIGELYGSNQKNVTGFIKSLSYTVPDESPWEHRMGYRVPKYITATIGFTILHRVPPGLHMTNNTNTSDTFFGIKNTMNRDTKIISMVDSVTADNSGISDETTELSTGRVDVTNTNSQ